MKSLFVIITLNLIQLVFLNSTNHVELQEFVDFCENELNLMAKTFSEKAKNISENLLKEEIIGEANTKPELTEFYAFLKDFLQDYQHLRRFHLYEPVIVIFQYLVANEHLDYFREGHIYKGEDFKQLMQLNFKNIIQEYEQEFRLFIKQKLLIKFANVAFMLKSEKSKHNSDLKLYMNNLRDSQDYEILKHNFNSLKELLPQDILIEISLKDFEKINILYSLRVNNFYRLLLKEERISKLNLNVQLEIKQILEYYIKTFSTYEDIFKFLNTEPMFTLKYFIYDKLRGKEFKSFLEIYQEHTIRIFQTNIQRGSGYYTKELLDFGLPSIRLENIPSDRLSLIQLVKLEVFNTNRLYKTI
ncbi:uncharacterized protein ACRADG_005607 [Cochliomyia hominivorax]